MRDGCVCGRQTGVSRRIKGKIQKSCRTDYLCDNYALVTFTTIQDIYDVHKTWRIK
jgi:hypothetical protein